VYAQFLVKKTPWTEDEVRTFNNWAVASADPANHRMDASNISFYRMLWSPDEGILDTAKESLIARAIEQPTTAEIITDIRPYTTTASEIQKKFLWQASSLILLILTIAYFALQRSKDHFTRYVPWAVYFVCVGIGYMFIEIFLFHWMQFYLGSIPLAFAVSIGGLFVAGGCASLVMQRKEIPVQRYFMPILLAVVCVLAGIFFKPFSGTDFYVRFAIAVTACGLVGALLAPFFSYGVHVAKQKLGKGIPFLVGINGGALAFGVPLALVLSASFGFFTLVAIAVFIYAIAIVMFRSFCYSE
jgi:hypothetical protein